MTTLGIIGSGNIGGTLARLAVAAGYDVVVSNSRGPETLTSLVAELGDRARAGTAQEAAAAGDLVVVSVPVKAVDDLPVEPLAGKLVLDTNNYYWQRDGHIPELDAQQVTSAGLLARHLRDAHVVKAFNHITAADLGSQGLPAGTPDRRALAIFGDDHDAKVGAAAFIDTIGYDAVDGGPLDESWRIEPGTPGYGPRFDAPGLRAALESATRPSGT